ncbi:MAG: HAD-IA family hydrolase [Chloroflexota bacterium]
MPDPDDLLLPLDAIVFDNDGVLCDSDASVSRSWAAWARPRGLDPDEVTVYAHGQRSVETVIHYCPPEEREAAAAEIERLELEDAAHVTPIPGALALTASVPRDRWGVVTSGSVALSGARLAAAGFPRPPFVVTADEVQNGKPDPEGYLKAIARLGVPAAHVAVLEDSPAGIRAAAGAGAGTIIGVGAGAVPTEATLVVRDLTALTWTGEGLLVRGAGRLR